MDQDKLGSVLEMKYHSVSNAVAEAGSVTGIRELFTGFQEYVYA